MNKEDHTTDATTEAADTEKTDDLSVEEQNGDIETSQESTTEQSDDDSPPDGNGDDSQTEPDPIEATEPEPLRSEPDAEYVNIPVSVEQRLLKLEELFTGQIARNQTQQRMFDTVYNEMKEYKENTLLEAFHKPIINNLIRLYDHFKEVETQLESINEASDSDGSEIEDSINPFESLETWFSSLSEKARQKFVRSNKELAAILKSVQTVSKNHQSQFQIDLAQFQKNLKIVRIELEEVLYRLDVIPYTEHPKKLDKELHKTINAIPTDNPDEDEVIKEIRKIGFYWREKVFRPEEVIIYRYEPSTDEPKETVSENPSEEKGDETDG